MPYFEVFGSIPGRSELSSVCTVGPYWVVCEGLRPPQPCAWVSELSPGIFPAHTAPYGKTQFATLKSHRASAKFVRTKFCLLHKLAHTMLTKLLWFAPLRAGLMPFCTTFMMTLWLMPKCHPEQNCSNYVFARARLQCKHTHAPLIVFRGTVQKHGHHKTIVCRVRPKSCGYNVPKARPRHRPYCLSNKLGQVIYYIIDIQASSYISSYIS